MEKLALGIFTSYEVTLAFSKRATIAHQVVSPTPRLRNARSFANKTFCLTEILFDEALARAQQLDDYLVSKAPDSLTSPSKGLNWFKLKLFK